MCLVQGQELEPTSSRLREKLAFAEPFSHLDLYVLHYREDAIGKCARAANRGGFTTFVLQNGGWCGGSIDAGTSYSFYSSSTACESDGEGGERANQVYEIDEVVES